MREGIVLTKDRLVYAGRAGSEQPKRFYRFQLIDPIDQPFATFRFYCYSWERLREMGLLEHGYYAESEEEGLDVIEPDENSMQEDDNDGCTDSSKVVYEEADGGDGVFNDLHDWNETKDQTDDIYKQTPAPTLSRSSSYSDSITSGSYIPRGAPASEVTTGSPPTLRRRRDLNRLSVPPSIKLDAPDPTPRPLPVPRKNDISSTAYRPHPAYPVEEWTVRTPSPVRSVRDGITTPPPGKRGMSGMGSGLIGAIQSTWKRSVSAAQATKKGEEGEEKRSVSY